MVLFKKLYDELSKSLGGKHVCPSLMVVSGPAYYLEFDMEGLGALESGAGRQ